MFHLKQQKPIQAKLQVGQPNDRYEQEADQVAEQVMQMPQTEQPIQRKGAFSVMGNGEGNQMAAGLQMKTVRPTVMPIQRKCSDCEEEDSTASELQMKGKTTNNFSMSGLENQLQHSKGGGTALTSDSQQKMEQGIGADFSQVKIHTDNNAIRMNQQLNARAFTNGNDIYFNQGEYQPHGNSGQRLLAHELTHVVQQSQINELPNIQRQCSPEEERTADWQRLIEGQGAAARLRSFTDSAGATTWITRNRTRFPNEELRCFEDGEVFQVYRRPVPAPAPAAPAPVVQPPVEDPAVAQPPAQDPAVAQPPAQDPAVAQPPAQDPAVAQPPAQDPAVAQPPATAPAVAPAPVQVPAVIPAAIPAAQTQLIASVGLGGTNNPADVLAVQQRLQQMGYLSAANFTTEQIQLPPPPQPDAPAAAAPTPINVTTIPHTMEAIAAFSSAAFGRPTLLITPGTASLEMLNSAMTIPLGTVNIGQAVGRAAPNVRADVQSVQDRLLAINELAANHHQQESVAALTIANIPDTTIPETINSIAGFNIGFVGISSWQIRPDSREENMLNNPSRFKQEMLTITTGVGTGQANVTAEVRSIQDRLLALGFLSQTHHTTEVVDPANPPNPDQIPDTQIPQTIAAIQSFQVTMGVTNNGQVTNGSETLRLLIRPNLPTARTINLGSTVGVGGGTRTNVNQPASVRLVQNRLHELGFLSTANYLAELADPTATANINTTQMPQTIAAIRVFQEVVVGVNDGNIDPGGKSARTLSDPTYGTLTSFNPEAANAQFGVAFTGGQGAQLNRLIQAIEQHEAGNRTGEAPADLINAGGVPASYGSAQMIASTGLGVLRQAGNQQIRDHYGLDNATLNTINDRATETANRFNQITGLVPAGGESEADLQVRITNYIQANGATFRNDTGLPTEDIAKMFRFGQIRRRILAATAGLATLATAPADVNAEITTLLANADFRASSDALGFNRGSLRAYVRNRRSMGENRAGFVSKAIFSHPESQRIRNALTDANGRSIGRMSISNLFNAANGVVPAGQANRDRTIAAVAARGHNSGTPAQTAFNQLTTILADPYVVAVLAIWDGLQAAAAPAPGAAGAAPAGGAPAAPAPQPVPPAQGP